MVDSEEYPDEKVKEIKLPVLIVHGDRDFLPLEGVLRIYNLIPNSELAVAPNSDHSLPMNNYTLFFNLISDFLQRHASNS